MNASRYSSFVPWVTMWMAFSPHSKEERHLKISTLLFDDVYLPVGERVLRNAGQDFARIHNLQPDQISRTWHSLDSIHSGFGASEFRKAVLSPPHELVFDKKGNWRRGLREAINTTLTEYFGISKHSLRKKHNEPLGRYEIAYEGNAHATAAVGSAVAWTLIRPHLDCSFFPLNVVEFAAARLILGMTSTEKLNAANLLLPDAGELTWQEVFEIRDLSEAESFRRWLHSRNVSDRSIEHDIVGALLEIVEECRPNRGMELFKGVVSNLPLPLPINPASLALSLKSIAKAQQFHEKYDWSLFLKRTRKTATDS
jgi:hypothetical protein